MPHQQPTLGRRPLAQLSNPSYPQDLHIHAVFSQHDSSVVPEQTPELVTRIRQRGSSASATTSPTRPTTVAFYGPHRERFRFVIGSDAHQPIWLSQSVARRAATELGIQEHAIEGLPAQG
jgi:histidinol phosphatase-like PHP family hydrolase